MHKNIFSYLQIFTLIPIILMCCSCSKVRMQETFEGEPQNVPPPQHPMPNPPNDDIIWTQQKMNPRVVSRSGGGQWVMIGPKEAIPEGQTAAVLSAMSGNFVEGIDRNVRGGVTMDLEGPGEVAVFLFSWSQEAIPLGGFTISNYPPGFGASSTAYLTSSDVRSWMADPSRRLGTGIGLYTGRTSVEFSWSMNQKGDSRGPILYINASPGGTASPITVETFPISPVPVQRIFILMNAYGWTQGTTLFVDDLRVEEQ